MLGRRLKRSGSFISRIEYADEVGLDVFGVGEHHREEFLDSAPAIVHERGLGSARRCATRLHSWMEGSAAIHGHEYSPFRPHGRLIPRYYLALEKRGDPRQARDMFVLPDSEIVWRNAAFAVTATPRSSPVRPRHSAAPRCTKCQSLANPSSLEYWHIATPRCGAKCDFAIFRGE